MATAARVAILDHRVAADCSCCGAEGTDQYPVFRAGLVDTDSTYYPRLCGSCMDSVEREIAQAEAGQLPEGRYDFGRAKREAAKVGLAVMPDEADDGLVALLEDFFDGDLPSAA